MRNYEIMFIVRPTLGEEDIKKVVKSFEDILTSNGAKITDFKEMGQRELAYEINKFKTGYYFLFNLESEDDKAINEFSRIGKNSKDIVRLLVTRVED